MQLRRPSITSLTPVSPLATASQTSPQRRPSDAHITLRRTASVGSPLPAFPRLGRSKQEQPSAGISYRQHDAHQVHVGLESAPHPEVSSEPHTPLRRKLRRNNVVSLSDDIRKTSE